MSPAEIRILLHYYTSPEPYKGEESTGFVTGVLGSFMANGLIEDTGEPNEYGSRYKTTKRGNVYVDMLCSTPFPVQVWVHPDKAKELQS